MGFFSKLKDSLKGVRARWSNSISSLFGYKNFDDSFWDELEGRLIAGDVGLDLSESLVADLKQEVKRRGITSPADLRKVFVEQVTSELTGVEHMGCPFSLENTPLVLLMIGVNGSGKTTSAGKLATQFLKQGRSVVMAAADTFRAAAIEQLQIWGQRTGVRVVAQKQGSDPAAVAFDAWQALRASGSDVLIVDTAGRLHAKHNLMEELGKIHRVLEREAGSEHLHNVLVLDAVMGQNAVAQAVTFNKMLPVSSIILSKYDNTAKGGVILSIARDLKIPVRYIGLGEGADDLSPFNPAEFAEALMGSEELDK